MVAARNILMVAFEVPLYAQKENMKPYYQDNHIELYAKDCRQMIELADNSVQCVVTSPPYWGLRKYSGEQELIWGDNHCEHQWVDSSLPKSGGVGDYEVGRVGNAKARSDSHDKKESATCSLCGAWKGAYGLEPTPEMYVQHTIEILREIRRVLRKDGVVFWNIGDCYVSQPTGSLGGIFANRPSKIACFEEKKYTKQNPKNYGNLKPKDLCLIPFRIAISAQNDGWWVMSVIIWSKPNPMPESVTDRPTESHEYILLLTKSARYYWDQDAVREGYTEPMNRWGGDKFYDTMDEGKPDNINRLSRADRLNRPDPAGRNIRTVWEFPTQPYPEAHFAVFPEKLPELCIKAATPEVGCCSKCGAPWERIFESKKIPRDELPKTDPRYRPNRYIKNKYADELREGFECGMYKESKTLGWQPTCKCDADKVPSLVLDCFAGAGTTLWVAKKLNRQAVGYEISQEYCELALDRNRQQVLELL